MNISIAQNFYNNESEAQVTITNSPPIDNYWEEFRANTEMIFLVTSNKNLKMRKNELYYKLSNHLKINLW